MRLKITNCTKTTIASPGAQWVNPEPDRDSPNTWQWSDYSLNQSPGATDVLFQQDTHLSWFVNIAAHLKWQFILDQTQMMGKIKYFQI